MELESKCDSNKFAPPRKSELKKALSATHTKKYTIRLKYYEKEAKLIGPIFNLDMTNEGLL